MGVVSRECQDRLTYAGLNGLDVFAADIRNAYLQAPNSCKDNIIYGPEFGLKNEGKVAPIHCALYGGKIVKRYFRSFILDEFLGFQVMSC